MKGRGVGTGGIILNYYFIFKINNLEFLFYLLLLSDFKSFFCLMVFKTIIQIIYNMNFEIFLF